MEKNNKKYDIKAITNPNKEDKIIAFVVNGKKYKLKKNEKISEIIARIATKENSKCFKKEFDRQQKNYEVIGYTKEEYKKHIKSVHQADGGLIKRLNLKKNKKKVIAGLTALALIASGTIYGLSSIKSPKTDKNAYATEQTQYQINESNKKLNKIYEKLLEHENGEEIVKKLKLINKVYDKINNVAIENPDANGKISYIKSEEVAAIYDVYNAQTDSINILENENLDRCNWLLGQSALVNLSQGSRQVLETHELFNEKGNVEYQKELEKAVQGSLNNGNKATPKHIQMLEDIYDTNDNKPEMQAEVSWGQAGLAGAVTESMSGKTLEAYQESSRTDAGQLAYLLTLTSIDTKKQSTEEQKLTNEALKIMNREDIKDKSRKNYNPSTTDENIKYINSTGDLAILSDGSYVKIVKTGNVTKKIKITRKEALKIDEKFVKESEKKVKIDTDGDGKNDTPLDEANKNEKEQGMKDSKARAEGYKDGQEAYSKGLPYEPGEGKYAEGYKEGWNRAKEVYEKQQAEDAKKEENEFHEEKSTSPTTSTEPTAPTPEEAPVIDEFFEEQTTRQKVESIETYNVEPTENETSYKSTARVRV